MASVQLRNVTKAWGDVVVSKDINLDIHEGEFRGVRRPIRLR